MPETEVARKRELVFYQPLGPQGPKLGLDIVDEGEYDQFRKKLQDLPERARANMYSVAEVAKSLGIPVVDF